MCFYPSEQKQHNEQENRKDQTDTHSCTYISSCMLCDPSHNSWSDTSSQVSGHPVKNPFDLSGSFYAAKQALTEACGETPFLLYDEMRDTAKSKNVFNLAIFKYDIRTAYEEMNQEKLRGIFASISELFSQHSSHYLQAMDAAGEQR